MFKCKLLLSIILILSFTQIIFAKDFPIDNEFTVQERLNCSIQAGLKYNVPIDVLLAISSIENGNIDTISKNTNNSYDYGVMQINSIYIKELNNKLNLDLKKEDFLKRDCFSFQVAAYKLKEHIKFDKGDLLTKLAMYHSKTPKYNEIYKKKIVAHAKYWSDFLLNNNFKLYLYLEMQQGGIYNENKTYDF